MAQILCIGDAMLDVIVKMQGQMYLAVTQSLKFQPMAAELQQIPLPGSHHLAIKSFMSAALEMMQLVELLLMNLMPGTLNTSLSF